MKLSYIVERVKIFWRSYKRVIVALAAVVTVIGFSFSDIIKAVGDYIRWYTGNRESDFLFAMKQKCMGEGERRAERDQWGKTGSISIPPHYEFTYNRKLHTCLIYYEHGTTKWVEDVLTNRILISYDSGKDSALNLTPLTNMANSLLEFNQKKNELFMQ